MSRYFIKLAYNGKHFHGWQKQLNAHSVQAEIETQLAVLLRKPIEILGCGRTDTGVHAKEFYAHFEYDDELDGEKMVFKLNALLPKSISIYKVFLVEPNIHARFDATYREYEYVITRIQSPFMTDFSWYYGKFLDLELMNQAAQLLLTHTDFECFSKVKTDVFTFNCKITKAIWEEKPDKLLVFTICADRFLRNMVRAIVGTLIDVGLHKTTLQDFKNILDSKNRSMAGVSVQPQGLFLTKVHYQNITHAD